MTTESPCIQIVFFSYPRQVWIYLGCLFSNFISGSSITSKYKVITCHIHFICNFHLVLPTRTCWLSWREWFSGSSQRLGFKKLLMVVINCKRMTLRKGNMLNEKPNCDDIVENGEWSMVLLLQKKDHHMVQHCGWHIVIWMSTVLQVGSEGI